MSALARPRDFLGRADEAELRLCRAVSRILSDRLSLSVFRLVSRLGDGMFWYALMGLLVLTDADGRNVALRMALTGLACLLVYRTLKHRLGRERAFIACTQVPCRARPLDRYSFPSGHTLHAVAFTTVTLASVPSLAVLLLPFTILVALSRVALGLHYPSDVVAGALIGLGRAQCVLAAFA